MAIPSPKDLLASVQSPEPSREISATPTPEDILSKVQSGMGADISSSFTPTPVQTSTPMIRKVRSIIPPVVMPKQESIGPAGPVSSRASKEPTPAELITSQQKWAEAPLVRRPFETTPIKTTAPRVLVEAAKLGFGLIEAIPRASAILGGEIAGRKTGEAKANIDLRRLGFETPNYITAAKEQTDAINNGENPWISGLKIVSDKTLDVAFGAQLVSDLAKLSTRILLKGGVEARIEAQNILDAYKNKQKEIFSRLKEAPLKEREQALSELANVKQKAEKVIKDYGPLSTLDKAKVNTARYTELLARETPITDLANPKMSEVASFPSRFAKPDISPKELLKSVTEGKPIISGQLPGYTEKPGQAMGLSIKKVEPVGFGEKPVEKTNSLIDEAKKYKTPEEFVKSQEIDYKMQHQAPIRGDGYNAPGYDVSGGSGGIYPKDIYTDPKAYSYYGHGGDSVAIDKQSIDLIRKMKDNPNADVTIYRAVPNNEKITQINPSDWVTINKNYAIQHGESALGGNYKVLSKKVKADEIFTDGNSIHEFGYDPRQGGTMTKSQLIDIWNKANTTPAEKPPVYEDDKGLSTVTLEKLKGRSTVSKEFISNLTNQPELKQQERDIIREVLSQYPDKSTVPVKEFAEKVKAGLLPLKRLTLPSDIMSGENMQKYEHISLPPDLRGSIENYNENIYESPVKTSAGSIHFNDTGTKNYFGHTRVEDLPDKKTRRVIEVQSDLYQKGNLEREVGTGYDFNYLKELEAKKAAGEMYSKSDLANLQAVKKELEKNPSKNPMKLYQYNDPTAHFRMVREEIKKAGEDGKTKLQFPTGETAMKIEGLDVLSQKDWTILSDKTKLTPTNLKVGLEVSGNPNATDAQKWIITDVLGDGKFKAVPKAQWEKYNYQVDFKTAYDRLYGYRPDTVETFDISGKVDTNNPIYRFYEKDLGRYLTNKFDARRVIDPQGVSWYEVQIKPEMASKPVIAFKKGATNNLERAARREGMPFDISPEEALTEARKIFDAKEVQFLFQEGTPEKNAFGLYTGGNNPMIELAKNNGKVQSKVLYHESFHAYVDNFLTTEEKQTMLSNIKRNLATLPSRIMYRATGYKGADLQAEEYAADDFANFVAGKKYIKANKSIYQRILDKIKEWIRKITGLEKIYKDILDKKRNYIKPKNTINNIPESKFKLGDIGEKETEKAKKFEDLRNQRESLQMAMELSPGKQLAKYESRSFPGSLPEISAGGAKTSKFGKEGDTIIQDVFGYESGADLSTAEKALKDYKNMRQRLKDLNKEIAIAREDLIKEKIVSRDVGMLKDFLDRNAKYTEKEYAKMASAKNKPTAIQRRLQERQKVANERLRALLEATYTTQTPLERESLDTLGQITQQAYNLSLEEFESMGVGDPLNKIVVDTSTSVKNKVRFIDYLKTPERVLKRIGLGQLVPLLRHSYESYLNELPLHLDVIREWSNRVSPEANKEIFRWLDGQQMRDHFGNKVHTKLTPKELAVAKEIKAYLEEWADRLGLPEDERLSHYITHVFGLESVEKEFDEDVAKIITDKVAGSVYDPFLEKRLGRKGYIEDTWQALDAYVKRAVRKANMDPALERFKNAVTLPNGDPRVELSQYRFVQRFVDRVNLRPTEIDNLMDNWFKDFLGYKLGARPTAVVTRLLRQTVYRAFLGLNIGSAVKNLTQGVNTYSVLGEKYTIIGYTKMVQYASNPALREELEFAGILKQDLIQDKTLSATKKNIEKMDKVLFSLFEMSEKIDRVSAYLGAKTKALDEGKNEIDAMEYAKKIVRDTQFNFGSIDTPVGLGSDITKLFSQFLTFGFKQFEFASEKISAKDWAGILRYIAASTAVVLLVGKIFNIKASDFIPGVNTMKFGGGSIFGFPVPPSLALPAAILGAITNQPGYFGQKRDLKEKVLDVAKAVPIPATLQAQKTFGGMKDFFAPEKKSVDKTPGNFIRALIFGKKNLAPTEESKIITEERAKSKEKVDLIEKNAEEKYKELSNMPKENAKIAFDKLLKEEPETAKKIVSIVKSEKLGLTQEDRSILSAGVNDGTRAKILARIFNLKKTKEEKQKLWEEYVKKGIITKTVSVQLSNLLK